MALQIEDTIAALATPPGVGAIAVVRVSGTNAIAVCGGFFRGKKPLQECASHTVHYGTFSAGGTTIDDVLVTVFKAPHSYTGEDSVEISTHGSPLISRNIIAALLAAGVRAAEPGEFTKRAFLNGRIDLAQAEAVSEIINSRTDASLKGARSQLDGLLSQAVNGLRQQLLNTSSLIELELDFAEEDLEFIGRGGLLQLLTELRANIGALLATYSFGRVLRDGINAALVGPPNAGKSSLLNYILKEKRAIVSHIPGTTRDIIREEVTIDGVLFRLYDTAGIRPTNDVIEQEGVLRSREAVRLADVVLYITDCTKPFPEELYAELLPLSAAEKIIIIRNKADLNPAANYPGAVAISAKTGMGVDALFTEMKNRALGNGGYSEKSLIISDIRHYNCLKRADDALAAALASISGRLSGEFIAADLRNAETALAEIIGEVTSDDILNNIFMKFCIGK